MTTQANNLILLMPTVLYIFLYLFYFLSLRYAKLKNKQTDKKKQTSIIPAIFSSFYKVLWLIFALLYCPTPFFVVENSLSPEEMTKYKRGHCRNCTTIIDCVQNGISKANRTNARVTKNLHDEKWI